MARRTQFTRDTVEKLLRAVRMGATYKLACMHAGISEDTLGRWRNGRFPQNLDADQKQLKADFADLFTRAEGDAGVRALSTIQQAMAQGDPKAAQWLLERRFPDDYGRSRVELTGKDGGPVEVASVRKKIDELARQIAAEEGIEEYTDDLVGAVVAHIEGEDEDGDDA